jgi:hypothetical protein
MWELIIKIWSGHWGTILVGSGVVLIFLAVYFISASRFVPPFVLEFINYINLKPEANRRIGLYSKVLALFTGELNWDYLFSQKIKGKELYFGHFRAAGQSYYLFITNEEVKPMVLTNTKKTVGYPIVEKLSWDDTKVTLETKERYLVENVRKSTEFAHDLTELMEGDRCWYEFTELGEVVLVTDHEFSTAKELIRFLAIFTQLKNKL